MLCRRLRRSLPSRRAGTHGHRQRSGPRLGRCERPHLASLHNAGQHDYRLVPLSQISPMVPLKVVQQVTGVEVGGPAVLAGFPRAVTSSIPSRPGADVDHLRSTLLRDQVAAEVPQHVPNVGIAAILRWGAPLGWRLGRCLWSRPRRSGRGRRRPKRQHAWWLRQVQRPPHGKLLLHPAAPRIGELLTVALDLPPGREQRPEPRPHVLRHDQTEGIP